MHYLGETHLRCKHVPTRVMVQKVGRRCTKKCTKDMHLGMSNLLDASTTDEV